MTMGFLRDYVKTDCVFVDIGANCGVFTLAAASLMNERGHVYAFEPGPPVLARLKVNLAINPGLKDFVTVVPQGLGKEPGRFFYKEEIHNRGNASLLNAVGTPVQVIRFDDWAKKNKLQRLDVVKIDVEGMEYDVLLGMRQSLVKWHPVIYFETLVDLQSSSGRAIKDVYEFLAGLGYRIGNGEDVRQEVDFNGPYPRNTVAVFKGK
jgi:FkbM family methyltransferase